MAKVIYRITSPSGRIYIGKTVNLKKRTTIYKWPSKCSNQTILQASILKYGWDAHRLEVINELPDDMDNDILNEYERVYIEHLQSNVNKYPKGNGMNLTEGGDGVIGYIFTEKDIINIKKGMVGKKMNILKGEDHPMFGIKGQRHPGFGYKHSAKAKNKISESQVRSKHNLARRVINTITGEIYGCLLDASEKTDLSYSAFRAQLSGQNKNKTNFIYYN